MQCGSAVRSRLLAGFSRKSSTCVLWVLCCIWPPRGMPQLPEGVWNDTSTSSSALSAERGLRAKGGRGGQVIFAVMYHASGLYLHAYSIGSTKKNFSGRAFARISLGVCFSTWIFCVGWNQKNISVYPQWIFSILPSLPKPRQVLPAYPRLSCLVLDFLLLLIVTTSWSPTKSQSASPCHWNETSCHTGAIPGVAAPLWWWILLRKPDEEWFDFCNGWRCRFIYFSCLSESTQAVQGHHVCAYIFYFFK